MQLQSLQFVVVIIISYKLIVLELFNSEHIIMLQLNLRRPADAWTTLARHRLFWHEIIQGPNKTNDLYNNIVHTFTLSI